MNWKDWFRIKKYWIVGATTTVVCVSVASGVYFLSQETKPLLKNDTFTIEYGERISENVKYYIASEEEEILKSAKVNIDYENEQTKDYPYIGDYKGVLSYGDRKEKFTVQIRDTVAPKWSKFKDEIKVEQNAENFILEHYFEASDLDRTYISVTGKVDLSTFGEYEVKVTAKDRQGNKITKKCKVIVVSKEEAKKSNVDQPVIGELPQSKELKEEIEKENNEEQTNNSTASNNVGSNSGGSTAENNNSSSNTNSSNGTSSNTGESQTPPMHIGTCDGVYPPVPENGYVYEQAFDDYMEAHNKAMEIWDNDPYYSQFNEPPFRVYGNDVCGGYKIYLFPSN